MSMTIKQEAQRIQQNIADSFEVVLQKGGVLPNIEVSGNLAESIRSIPQTSEPAPTIDYGLADLPIELQTGTLYTFMSSKGDVFFSTNVANTGIWKLNKDTNNIVKIYEIGSAWQHWFEDSQGNIFVSSNSTSPANTGILRYSDGGFVQVHSAANRWQHWFEDSQGNVFVSGVGGTAGSGILRYSDGGFVQVHAIGSTWQFWLEDSQGNVFVSSNVVTSVGILRYTDGGFVQVHSADSRWQYWFEDSQGNLFVSSSLENTGILRYVDGEFVQVMNNPSGSQIIRFWFEDSQGNVFLSSTASGFGIYKWNNEIKNIEMVYPQNDNWQYWFEDSQGNIFVSSSTANTGIVKYNSELNWFEIVSSLTRNWRFWFEDSQGNVFVSGTETAAASQGIFVYNGTDFTRLITSGDTWSIWHEDSLGNVFVSSSRNAILGILKYTGTTFVTVQGVSSDWKIYDENGSTKAVNNFLSGELTYDEYRQRFLLSRVDYTGRTFGKYTMFSDVHTVCRIYSKDGGVVVGTVVTASPVTIGDYAFARTLDDKVLYV